MSDYQLQHVFISYVREDRRKVDKLCQAFEKHGVKYWIDRNDIEPGSRWQNAIYEAIRKGSFFIACFSDAYSSKLETYMNEELTLAIDVLRRSNYNRKWFIPVLLSECNVPARSIGAGETLLDINWVPLYEDWDTNIKKILSVINPIPPRIHSLILALKQENLEIKLEATKALWKLGPEASAALPTLIETINSEDLKIRSNVVSTLGQIGTKAKEAVPALIKALKLKDQDEGFRWQVVDVLGKIGPEAESAVTALIQELGKKNTKFQCHVAKALGEIGPKAKTAVPVLIEMLKGEDKELRWHAIDALGKTGAEAIPTLIEALKEEDREFRWHVAKTIGKIGPHAKMAVPALTNVLKYQNAQMYNNIDMEFCWQIVASLGNIGSEAKMAVPAMLDSLKNKYMEFCWHVVDAIKKIGPAAVPALIEALKNEYSEYHWCFVIALGNFGHSAIDAVPILKEMLIDVTNPVDPWHINNALNKIQNP